MRILLLIIIIVFCRQLSAQTEKGNFLLGGYATGYFSDGNNRYLRNLQIYPTAGIFLADNIALTTDGLAAIYVAKRSHEEYALGLLPGLKGFLPLSEKFYLTLQLKGGYVYSYNKIINYSIEDTVSFHVHDFQYSFGPGIAWFVTNTTAFTIDFPYWANINLNNSAYNKGFLRIHLGAIVTIPSKANK